MVALVFRVIVQVFFTLRFRVIVQVVARQKTFFSRLFKMKVLFCRSIVMEGLR